MIPESVIDEVRSRVDIVAVIGRHLELKRSGRTWKGCCVFHGERTPSFHVYPEDRHFKCYGCGEYGDVFKFLQKLQGKEFPEVVRALAAEVGVEIPEREEDSAEQRRRRQERAEVLAACAAAARYFAARLSSAHGEPGRAYLASRGLADETVRQFRLGLASTAWDDLVARLEPKGVSETALEKAGLVAHRDGARRYDRFRGRLIVPISGLDGEVIGFGGRVLPGAPDKLAKYINSPESVLYKKSKVLYGIDLAREHVRRTRQAVLVEGYFDVIGLHQAGVKNAVAVCGTALTPEHVDLLKRCDCREVVLLFDGDPAGQAAPARAAQALLPSGITGKVALLPAEAGKVDPDEFARTRGLAALEKLLAVAVPLTEFLLDRALQVHCGPTPAAAPVEMKLAAFRELRPFLSLVPAGLARTLFEERVAKRLDVSLAALVAELDGRQPSTREDSASREVVGGAAPRELRISATANRQVPSDEGNWLIRALALLAAFPTLAEVASAEQFSALFIGSPLEPIARVLIDGGLSAEEVAESLEPLLSVAALGRFRDAQAAARPDVTEAEREFRKAVVEAKLQAVEQEIGRLSQDVLRAGPPVPQELVKAMLIASNRRKDLEKRRDGRRPG